MDYRREIDGLRALAVVPVILFHAGFEMFGGGYVGVDVFFVISGYLITSIILDELRDGRFSIVRFYDRRARRILPAMFVVLAACLPFAWVWLLPRELESFSKSLIAVAFFVSNIFFWREDNYFEAASEMKPLLHTWSLGVEEQFYILFPLFLLLMWRFAKRWIIGLLIPAFVVSIALAEWGSIYRPTAAFFLLPTRGWELALGFFIAFYFAGERRFTPSRAGGECLGLAGLAMIAFSVFAYGETTPFPGLYALVPTLGTALIILFAWPDTLVGRLLGHRALVGVGLISYSAYLWHQPLFSFARHKTLIDPGPAVFLFLSLLTFVLAFLSWRFVEQPFRRRGTIGGRTLVIFSVAGSLAFASIGAVGMVNEGFPGRLSSELLDILSVKDESQEKRRECHSGGRIQVAPDEACILGDPDHVVGSLLGDSHAYTISKVLDDTLAAHGLGLKMYTFGGCPPILGVYRIRGEDRDLCQAYNEEVFRLVEQDPQSRFVVFVARYSLYVDGTPFDNKEGWRETIADLRVDALIDDERVRHGEAERQRLTAQRHTSSLQKYLDTGKKVVLVYPIPEVGWDTPNALVKRLMNRMGPLTTSYERYEERNALVLDALDALGDQPNLFRIHPEQIFCNADIEGRCETHVGSKPLYDDDDHLSNFGSQFIVDLIVRRLLAE